MFNYRNNILSSILSHSLYSAQNNWIYNIYASLYLPTSKLFLITSVKLQARMPLANHPSVYPKKTEATPCVRNLARNREGSSLRPQRDSQVRGREKENQQHTGSSPKILSRYTGPSYVNRKTAATAWRSRGPDITCRCAARAMPRRTMVTTAVNVNYPWRVRAQKKKCARTFLRVRERT